MKFAKHLAKAMRFSDPEWLPFWINYRFLKKLLPSKGSPVAPMALAAPAVPTAPPATVVASQSTPPQNSAIAAPTPASPAKSAFIITGSPSSARATPFVSHFAGQGDRCHEAKAKPAAVAAVRDIAATDGRGHPWQQQLPRELDIIQSPSSPSGAALPPGSSVVSEGGKITPQPCPPLPRQQASSSLAVDKRNGRVSGSSDIGSYGSLGQRKVAPTSGKRKAFGATYATHRARVYSRPTCCSRPSSGCTAAAIAVAAAVGLCPPASLASPSAASAPPADATVHPAARSEEGRSWQRPRQGKQEQQPREQQPWQLQQKQLPQQQQQQQQPQRWQQREVGKGREERGGAGARGIGGWTTMTSPPPPAATPTPAPALSCPFFSMLLREICKCRVFFLQNENDLKARTTRLQFALNQLKNPELSRLSTVKGFRVRLMQACMKFYRDALLLEDFAMVNYTAVIKLLKKRDKLTGASDQKLFMDKVMAAQPFAMYPGVAERVAQVEEIFREIEDMCFLRTGAGMKSVMKTELTVVEAILQLAQESEDNQNRVLHDNDAVGPSMSRGSFRRRSLLKDHSGDRRDSSTGMETSAARTATGDDSSRTPGGIPPSSNVGRRSLAVGVGPPRWVVAGKNYSSQAAEALATRMPVAAPRRPGSGNPTGISERGRERGKGEKAGTPTSVRVFVSPRSGAPHEEKEEEKQAELVLSATGMMVSATRTPRLSTNAPRLSVTTASLGRGGVPKATLG